MRRQKKEGRKFLEKTKQIQPCLTYYTTNHKPAGYIPQNLEYTQNLQESPKNSQEHQKPERNIKKLVTTKKSPKTIKEQLKTPENTENVKTPNNTLSHNLVRPTSLLSKEL